MPIYVRATFSIRMSILNSLKGRKEGRRNMMYCNGIEWHDCYFHFSLDHRLSYLLPSLLSPPGVWVCVCVSDCCSFCIAYKVPMLNKKKKSAWDFNFPYGLFRMSDLRRRIGRIEQNSLRNVDAKLAIIVIRCTRALESLNYCIESIICLCCPFLFALTEICCKNGRTWHQFNRHIIWTSQQTLVWFE